MNQERKKRREACVRQNASLRRPVAAADGGIGVANDPIQLDPRRGDEAEQLSFQASSTHFVFPEISLWYSHVLKRLVHRSASSLQKVWWCGCSSAARTTKLGPLRSLFGMEQNRKHRRIWRRSVWQFVWDEV